MMKRLFTSDRTAGAVVLGILVALALFYRPRTVTETRFYPVVDFEAYKRDREEDARRWLLLNQRLERMEKKPPLPGFKER